MNACNTTIENGVIKVKTEKSKTVYARQAVMRISLSGTGYGSCAEEIEMFLVEEKEELVKKISYIIERGVICNPIKERVMEYITDSEEKLYEFCCEFEIWLIAEDELFPIEKWKKITDTNCNVEMKIYYLVPDLEKAKEELMTKALLLNCQKAELLAKSVKKTVTWPKNISYTEYNQSNKLPIHKNKENYAGYILWTYDAERETREFMYELKTTEMVVTEEVYVEWIII